MRIVLVDDDPDLIEIMYLALQQAGHKITAAPGGVSILSTIKAQHPDLLITDLMMAEMDGIELCQMALQDKRLTDMQVIVVSARTDPLWKDKAKACGAIGFIEKPIDPMTFADQIERMVHDAG